MPFKLLPISQEEHSNGYKEIDEDTLARFFAGRAITAFARYCCNHKQDPEETGTSIRIASRNPLRFDISMRIGPNEIPNVVRKINRSLEIDFWSFSGKCLTIPDFGVLSYLWGPDETTHSCLERDPAFLEGSYGFGFSSGDSFRDCLPYGAYYKVNWCSELNGRVYNAIGLRPLSRKKNAGQLPARTLPRNSSKRVERLEKRLRANGVLK